MVVTELRFILLFVQADFLVSTVFAALLGVLLDYLLKPRLPALIRSFKDWCARNWPGLVLGLALVGLLWGVTCTPEPSNKQVLTQAETTHYPVHSQPTAPSARSRGQS